jgi:RND family efflux transporter MFP subunit
MTLFNLRKTASLLTAVLFVTSTSFSFSALSQNFPAASVNVVQAKNTSLAPVSWVSGTVVSRNDSKLAAEIAGRLISIAEIGSQVHRGDIIAQIDDKTLQNQLKEDQASVNNAKAQLAFLQSEYKRKKALAKQNLSAITDLDKTLSERNVAQGDLTVANAKLAQTQQNLTYSQLKAPFDGLIVQRLSNLGEYVNNGTAIIRLVQTTQLEASVFVPVTSYQYIKQNVSAKKPIAIKSAFGNANVNIKALVPVADQRSHLMEARLDLSQLNWPVGLNIKVAIANGTSKKVLAIPRDALILRRDGISIFKVNKDNKTEQISVSVGIGAGEWVEIIGNVTVGDNIIVRGSERLKSGQTVQIKNNNQDLVSSKTDNSSTTTNATANKLKL